MPPIASTSTPASPEHLDLDSLLRQKNLNPETFFTALPELSLESPIEQHGEFAFEAIYRHPYPGEKSDTVPRYHHGIAHVSRVAAYIPVFANLYRKYDVPGAVEITPERLKLLQIAALFHDAARENDGEDVWDHESALMLYGYLRRRLNVSPAQARLIAEATANKDLSPKGAFYIEETAEGVITSGFDATVTPENHTRNVYAKLIHDADCLDIQRVRPHFKGRYLEFQQHIERMPPGDLKEEAIAERAELICEARALIALQGDAYKNTDTVKKRSHACRQGTAKVFEEASHFALPDPLRIDTSPYNPDGPLDGKNMMAAMREGLVLARGISYPTESQPGPGADVRTNADIDLQKTMRTRGIATPTQKPNRREKEGNPIRSFTMLGYGSDSFADAGFLAFRDDSAISYVATTNSYTGTGKKSARMELDKTQRPDMATVTKQMDALYEQLRLGGDSSMVGVRSKTKYFESSHNEILMDVYQYKAIYFSNDPNFHNPKPRERKERNRTSLLQAVYLRQEYARHYGMTREKYLEEFGETEGLSRFEQRFGNTPWLPVFEYSKHQNRLDEVPQAQLSDENFLFKAWQQAINAYWVEVLFHYDRDLTDLQEEALETVRVRAVYGNTKVVLFPVDRHCTPELREKINAWILEKRDTVLYNWEAAIRERLHSGDIPFEVDGYLYAAKSPALREEFRERARAIFPEKIAEATRIRELRELQSAMETFGIASALKPQLLERAALLFLPDVQKTEEASDILTAIHTFTHPHDWFSEPLKTAVARRLMDITNAYGGLTYGLHSARTLENALTVLSFLDKRHFKDCAPAFNVLQWLQNITAHKGDEPAAWADAVLALEKMLPNGFSEEEGFFIFSHWQTCQGDIDVASPFNALLENAKDALNTLIAQVLEDRDTFALEEKMRVSGSAMKREMIAQLAALPGGRALLEERLEVLRAHWKEDEDSAFHHLYTALLIMTLPPQRPSAGAFFSPEPDDRAIREAAGKILQRMDGEAVSFTASEIALLKESTLGIMLGDALDELPMSSSLDAQG